MSMTPSGDFQPVTEEKEREQLLLEGARSLASAFIWTQGRDLQLRTHLQVYDAVDGVLFFTTPAHFDSTAFSSEITQQDNSNCLFSLSLSRANVFFKSAYLGVDPGGLKFKAPTALFKIQRRKDLRHIIPETVSLRANFIDPTFPSKRMTKKVLDISAGGLSLLIQPSDEPLFQNNLILADLHVQVNGRLIKAKAEVRHSRPQPSGTLNPGTKVGIQFYDLRPTDADWIAAFVFEETRKVFQRLMD